MNYTKIKQLHLSLLPLFVTRTRKEKKGEKKKEFSKENVYELS